MDDLGVVFCPVASRIFHGEAARLTLHEAQGDRHIWMQRSTTFGNGPSERLIPSPSQTGTSEITVLWSDGEQQRMEISPDAAKLRIQRN